MLLAFPSNSCEMYGFMSRSVSGNLSLLLSLQLMFSMNTNLTKTTSKSFSILTLNTTTVCLPFKLNN